MIARGFKPVGWVAAVAGAALSCYMLSLRVASERADLASVERQIIAAKQNIRSLQTELGTRGRLTQLEHWNAEVLALSAPSSAQFLDSEVTLARFEQRDKTIEERAKVVMAAQVQPPAPPKAELPVIQAKAEPAPAAQPRVIQASAEIRSLSRPAVIKASLETKPAVPQTAAGTRPRPSAKSPPAAAKPARPKPIVPVKQASLLDDDKLAREIGEAAKTEKKRGGPGAP
jgi:hypothetical protein